jgi:hypothetical protein
LLTPRSSKGALGFFACLRIDVAGKQPYPEYAIRNHTKGFWVGDVQQECFAGWHRPWALYFGVPVAFLLCIGVPLGLFWFMWHSRAEMADADFREHPTNQWCTLSA